MTTYTPDFILSKFKEFSSLAVKIEKEYNGFFALRTDLKNKKIWSATMEAAFMDLSDAVNKERSTRLLILKGLNAVGANPADYGISVYGLSQSEIQNAYPNLLYDKTEARLGFAFIPLAFVDAAFEATLAGLIA